MANPKQAMEEQASLLSYFTDLEDPRVERTQVHPLESIVFISIAAIACGADTWNEIEAFGQAKAGWLHRVVPLPGGIPSHDTFNRFFSALEPGAFEGCFAKWAASIATRTKGQVVSMDGKALRGTKGVKRTAAHVVTAWSGANNVSLGQLRVEDTSNETATIPALLDMLFIEDCIVTIDAAGCYADIAGKISAKDAHYILCVKGNQPTLLKNIEVSFALKTPQAVWEDLDAGHGRVETRRCSVISDLGLVENPGKWPGLQTLVRVDGERFMKTSGEIQTITRYFITDLPADDPQLIGRSIRSHWGIENSLHWQLDVSYREDASRKRNTNALINFSALSKMTLTMLKQDKSTRIGVKSKRLKAGWDNGYLLKILKV